MSAVAQVPAATPAPITDTGMRGFLKWFKQNQPEIYAKVAPKLAATVPAAFSQYHAGGWKIAGLSAVDARKKLRALYRGRFAERAPIGDLGQYYNFLGTPQTGIASAANAGANFTSAVNNAYANYASYNAAATQPSYASYVSAAAAGAPVSGSFAAPVDVAMAANIGPTSSAIVGTVGSLVNLASSAYLTTQAAQAQSNLVNVQLQRAAAGLPPLTTTTSSLGIPMVTGTSLFGGSSGMLFLLLGVGAIILVSSGKKKSE